MRILVTGASGYLGRWVAQRLAAEHEVTGTYLSVDAPIPGCRLERLDMAAPDTLRELIKRLRPDAVVHTAAMARPDACEKDGKLARVLNVDAVEAAARGAAEAGARLIYISTDLVFDGKSPPYKEESPTNPLSFYAKLKLEGERRVRELCPAGLTLRMALIYGWKMAGTETFTGFMYRSFKSGRKVKLFTDQLRSALYVEDAAEIIARLLALPGGAEACDGVLHMAGPQTISRLRFGELFCRIFGLDRNLIEPTRVADMPLSARRPLDCTLDGSRLFRALNFTPRTVEQAFLDMLSKVP
ncbi:MAG: SDR family oxidoreductase [Elusimicrobiota bacterium]